MPHPNKLIIASTCIGIAIVLSHVLEPRQFDDLGTHDFVEYWAAYKIARLGQNPYSPELMLAAQQQVGWKEPLPLMMWNPPWLLFILAPILNNEFHTAARMFIAVNTCLTLLLAWLNIHFLRLNPRNDGWIVVSILIFAPIWQTIYFGQTSLIVALGLILLLIGTKNRRGILCGTGIVLASIKSHLLYLVLAFVTIWLIKQRAYRTIFVSLIVFTGVAIATEMTFPRTMEWWLGSGIISKALAGAVPPLAWKTATPLSTISDAMLLDRDILLVAVPAGSLLLLLYWMRNRDLGNSVHAQAPIIVLLSVITSPFGWFFDFSVLLLPCLAITHGIQSKMNGVRSNEFEKALWLIVQLLILFFLLVKVEDSRFAPWYPLILLSFYLAIMIRERRQLRGWSPSTGT